MRAAVPRIMIAGTASGVGKTTLSCGLLRALARRGLRIQACKCGPDYLDPSFHEQVLGIPSRSLDLFLAGSDLVRALLACGGRTADLTLIEGAMGYYDGIAQGSDASAYDVARMTETPVVLVVDARGRARSCSAEVVGYAHFVRDARIVGVVLNHVSKARFASLKAMVERDTGIDVLGYLPDREDLQFASRHLGLVCASEIADLQARMEALAELVETTVDLDTLLARARSAPALDEGGTNGLPDGPLFPTRTSIAIARDEAFSFYYSDTLRLLEALGARLVFFSPLHDDALPPQTDGLYLGGGYPELHAKALSRNETMRASIREAVAGGMPTIAECGGFLYLQQSLTDETGRTWPMVGALPGSSANRGRLIRFGYVALEARTDSLLARAGETLRAHEFHYWDSTHPGDSFVARKPQSTRKWDCVVATSTLYAGFPHLYLPGCPEAARRFVDACASYGCGEVRL